MEHIAKELIKEKKIQKPLITSNWEMFHDISHYNLYCVRPINDHNFNSPRSFHFFNKKDAEDFLNAVVKAFN